MEEERRVLFDASAYMLFEASGDSESAFSDAAFHQESDSPAADEDAQSCSSAAARRLHEAVDGGGEFLEFDYCSGDYEEDDDGGGGSDEEEDGVVDQCSLRSRNSVAEIPNSKGCEESNAMTMMNEREGDRLFWEACLAS